MTATANSSTTIAVMWDEVIPIDQNGVITVYEVMYTPQENFNGTIGSNTTILYDAERSVVLIGLQEYVNYSISVRAFTTVGPSNYSNVVIEETFEAGIDIS